MASELRLKADGAMWALDVAGPRILALEARVRVLTEALSDLLWAAQIQPSCQKGVVNPCRCLKCADKRARTFLRDSRAALAGTTVAQDAAPSLSSEAVKP